MEIKKQRVYVLISCHGVPAGSLSRSNSEDLKQAKNMSQMYLNSAKPAPDHGKRQSKVPNQQNSDSKFPGKKCRGGIAWTVDELAEQNKQRAVN